MAENSKEPPTQTTKEKLLSELTEHLKNAEEAQAAATAARQRADETKDDEEAAHALEEAALQEKRYKSEIKIAQRLQSGVWQGGAAGAGMGAGVGAGVGTLVGGVVGGVTAIPTTGLGLLIGAGTGAIHGPWVKLPWSQKEADEIGTEETVVDGGQEGKG